MSEGQVVELDQRRRRAAVIRRTVRLRPGKKITDVGSAYIKECGDVTRAAIEACAGADPAVYQTLLAVIYYTASRCKYADDGVTRPELAKVAGCSQRSVTRGLAWLTNHGIIRYEPGFKTPRGGSRASRIELVCAIGVPATHVPDVDGAHTDECATGDLMYGPDAAYGPDTDGSLPRKFSEHLSPRGAPEPDDNDQGAAPGDEREIDQNPDPIVERIVEHLTELDRTLSPGRIRTLAASTIAHAETYADRRVVDEGVGIAIDGGAKSLRYIANGIRMHAQGRGLTPPPETTQ